MMPASAVGTSGSPPLAIAVAEGGWEEDEAMGRKGESVAGENRFTDFSLSSFSFSPKQNNTKRKTLLSPFVSLSFCKTKVLNEGS